jgi:hypothetical protein
MSKFFVRKCTFCDKGMNKGYLVDGETFCEQVCIESHFGTLKIFTIFEDQDVTYAEFVEHLNNLDLDDFEDSDEYNRCTEDYYWTEWYDDDVIGTFYDTDGNEIKVEILKQSL